MHGISFAWFGFGFGFGLGLGLGFGLGFGIGFLVVSVSFGNGFGLGQTTLASNEEMHDEAQNTRKTQKRKNKNKTNTHLVPLSSREDLNENQNRIGSVRTNHTPWEMSRARLPVGKRS